MSFLSDNEGPLRIVSGLVGTCLTAGCGFCPVMAIIEVFNQKPVEEGTFGAAFVGAVFAAAGVALLVLAFRGWGHEAKEKAKREAWQRQVLELADDRDGEITVSKLAMETPYTLEEAETYLDEFVQRGAASLDISSGQGQKLYTFPALRQGETTANTLEGRIDAVLEKADPEAPQSEDRDELAVLDTPAFEEDARSDADESVALQDLEPEAPNGRDETGRDETSSRAGESVQRKQPERPEREESLPDSDETQQMFAADVYDDDDDERSD